MEIETIRSFLAVADGHTVTEAAELANRTQPAMSRALARLEHQVGSELFQRVGRGVVLTPAGHELVPYARSIVEAYDRGLRAVQDMTAPDGGFVPVAFLHTLGTWLVPELVQQFRLERPEVRFDLRQHGDAGLVEDLLSGVVDMAITGDRPDHAQIESIRLLEEPLRLVVPPNHHLANRKSVRLRDAAGETFIALKPGFSLRDVTTTLCAQAGFEPIFGFEGEEVDTIRGLVAAGLGVALLPTPHSGGAPTAPHLEISDVKAVREIGLAWMKDRRLPPASEHFRTHVASHAREALAARS